MNITTLLTTNPGTPFSADKISALRSQEGRALAIDTDVATQKIALCNKWLLNNASHGAKALVTKFSLVPSIISTYPSGMHKIGLYTDETLRFLVTEITDDGKAFFRA